VERRARVDKHARTTRTLLPPIPLNNYPPGSASHPAIPAGAGSNGVDWPACPVAQPEAAVRSQGQHLKVLTTGRGFLLPPPSRHGRSRCNADTKRGDFARRQIALGRAGTAGSEDQQCTEAVQCQEGQTTWALRLIYVIQVSGIITLHLC
jgi:hypothetical protein